MQQPSTRALHSGPRDRARRFLLAGLGALAVTLGACGGYQETVELSDAYVDIYVAIGYKANECGNRPAYPLLMLDEPSRYAVDACLFAIVRGECPFNDYPILCFELYNTDVPGVGPELRIPRTKPTVR